MKLLSNMPVQIQMALPGMYEEGKPPPVIGSKQGPLGRGYCPYVGVSQMKNDDLKVSLKLTDPDQTINVGEYSRLRMELARRMADVTIYTVNCAFKKFPIELNNPFDWDALAYFGVCYAEGRDKWTTRVWDPTTKRFWLLRQGRTGPEAKNAGEIIYFTTRLEAADMHDWYYRNLGEFLHMTDHLAYHPEFEKYAAKK